GPRAARRRPEARRHALSAPAAAARRAGGRSRGASRAGVGLMCGLAGIARREPRGVAIETLDRMAAALRHRGPDGAGHYADARVGLAHVRLSIIDGAGG